MERLGRYLSQRGIEVGEEELADLLRESFEELAGPGPAAEPEIRWGR